MPMPAKMKLPPEADSSISANESLGDKLQRYEQLKVSVQALRSQVRSNPSPRPSLLSQPSPIPPSLLQPPWTPCGKKNWNGSNKCGGASSVAGIACLVEEPAAMQLLRIQTQLEHETETRALKEKLNRKIKKIEALKLENSRFKKKSQARLTFFDGRCQTLEAQLAEQEHKLTKELDAKQAVFDDSCRKDEEEHQRVLGTLRSTYEATIDYVTKEHEVQYSKTQSRLMGEVHINETLRNQVARLEAEVASVSSKADEAESFHRCKEQEWNLKLQCYGKIHDDRVATFSKELADQKATWEKEKRADEEKHAVDMSSYKQQKMTEIDCLTDRVKSALETKDKTILQLKAEIKKLQRHFSQTTQMFQEQACDLLQFS